MALIISNFVETVSLKNGLHFVSDFLHQLIPAHPFISLFTDKQRVLHQIHDS